MLHRAAARISDRLFLALEPLRLSGSEPSLVGTWLSLVEHSLGVRGVGSSNLPVPTNSKSVCYAVFRPEANSKASTQSAQGFLGLMTFMVRCARATSERYAAPEIATDGRSRASQP